jgi:ribosomal subunit interface protein
VETLVTPAGTQTEQDRRIDVTVTGRNVVVPDHFRAHVADKLSRTERYDHKIIRVEVELSHEGNPRQSKSCQQVEITLVSRGPAMRAEACADNFYGALDKAVAKLESQLRRAHDRRRDRQHERTPISAVVVDGEAVGAVVPPVGAGPSDPDLATDPTDPADPTAADAIDGSPDPAVLAADELSARYGADGGPGRIVRIKDHPGDPITVDQALYQMELVGHDFYLFRDADTDRCSVVYRRHGFDYGLLRLT